jgi:spore coat polysaccharide biosynthesis protein SpsF
LLKSCSGDPEWVPTVSRAKFSAFVGQTLVLISNFSDIMTKSNVAIIVQARMGSTRLPGKVLKTVLGRPLLEYQIERLKRVRNANEIIIATSELPIDDSIERLARQLSVYCFRGSEDDVLSRYYYSAKAFSVDVVVRSTADSPLIDPGLIEVLVEEFFQRGGCAYGSNGTIVRSYPLGLDAEVFSFRALEDAFYEAIDSYDREHVTQFITDRPERYPSFSLKHEEDLSFHRWTVDTPEDYELVKRIIESLYPRKKEFSWLDVVDLMKDNPDWLKLNAHIDQKLEKHQLKNDSF